MNFIPSHIITVFSKLRLEREFVDGLGNLNSGANRLQTPSEETIFRNKIVFVSIFCEKVKIWKTVENTGMYGRQRLPHDESVALKIITYDRMTLDINWMYAYRIVYLGT